MNAPMNNILKKTDLIKSIGTIHRNLAISQDNLPPVVQFNDDFDTFTVELKQTDTGYHVTCIVNGELSPKINGRQFEPSTSIGKILIIASGSKESPVHNDNAYVLSFFS